jgi:hypothetical protein
MTNEINEVEEKEEETSTDDVETSNNNEEQNPTNDNEKTLQAQKEHWKKKYNDLKDKGEEVKPNKPKETSSEPDRMDKLELRQLGVDNPDDMQMVIDEAKLIKKDVLEVAGMDYMKAKLTASKNQRKAEAGMPKGKGDTNSKTKADVDYWIAKGETPSDPDLAEKVINARMAKEEQGSKFSDELYTG